MLIFRFSRTHIPRYIKRSLIIPIFFLYLLIFANENVLLYQHKTTKGVEWKNFGDSKIHPKYEGKITNNQPDGKGKLTYPNGNNFNGFWKNGKIHGQGTFSWFDGRKYKGFFDNGSPKGKGTYIYQDGSKKMGKWKNSKENIFWENKHANIRKNSNKKLGVLSYRKENARWGWFDYGYEGKDGKYIGEITNLKPNGYGEFTFGIGRWEGDKYEGMWKNGEFDGEGTLTRKNGEKFKGVWKNNNLWDVSKFSKFGEILRKYVKGIEVPLKKKILIKKKKHTHKKEKGILYLNTPRKYWQGIDKTWSKTGNERKHGKYEGEIVNGLPNGHGIYSWFNVNKYIGEFKNGMFHGMGTFYSLPSKVKIVGEFRNDKEWNAIQSDSEGEIIGNFVNGELR